MEVGHSDNVIHYVLNFPIKRFSVFFNISAEQMSAMKQQEN